MRYPVFLVNLDRQPQRLRFMQAQLGALGITPIRIPAVNGRDPAERARAAAASYAPLSPGEVGCFESHRRLWQKMVDEGISAALVIEDDVIVASDFATLDFETAGVGEIDVVKVDAGIAIESWYGVRHHPLPGGRSLQRMLGTEFSTGCYFITLSGARKLLSQSDRYFVPVDRFMFDQNSRAFWQMNAWKLSPAAATQQQEAPVTGDSLGTEIADSISGGKGTGAERTSAADFWKRQRIRIRRLMDMDLRSVRERRKRDNMQAFRATEQTEKRFIPFESEGLSHVDTARRAAVKE